MRPSAAEIMRHDHGKPPPGADPFLPGHALTAYTLRVEDYDEEWARRFADVERLMRAALGDRVRELYACAKRTAAERTNAVGGHGMDYNAHKQEVVHEIYDRMFRAHGLL